MSISPISRIQEGRPPREKSHEEPKNNQKNHGTSRGPIQKGGHSGAQEPLLTERNTVPPNTRTHTALMRKGRRSGVLCVQYINIFFSLRPRLRCSAATARNQCLAGEERREKQTESIPRTGMCVSLPLSPVSVCVAVSHTHTHSLCVCAFCCFPPW